MRELIRFMGLSASNSIAYARRCGLGRLRHLGVKWLLLQQLIGAGQVLTVKDKELENMLSDAAMEECRTRRTPVYVAPIKGSHSWARGDEADESDTCIATNEHSCVVFLE